MRGHSALEPFAYLAFAHQLRMLGHGSECLRARLDLGASHKKHFTFLLVLGLRTAAGAPEAAYEAKIQLYSASTLAFCAAEQHEMRAKSKESLALCPQLDID